MARKSPTASLHERLYNLALSVDYDQPTSLEGDLDFLADGLIEEYGPEDFEHAVKEGYLVEVLEAIPDPDKKLAAARESAGEIDEILGRMAYGQLDPDDARDLEDHLNDLISELEKFLK